MLLKSFIQQLYFLLQLAVFTFIPVLGEVYTPPPLGSEKESERALLQSDLLY